MPGPTDHDDVDGADHDAADQLIAMRGMRTPVPSRSNHDGSAYQIVAHINVETTKSNYGVDATQHRRGSSQISLRRVVVAVVST